MAQPEKARKRKALQRTKDKRQKSCQKIFLRRLRNPTLLYTRYEHPRTAPLGSDGDGALGPGVLVLGSRCSESQIPDPRFRFRWSPQMLPKPKVQILVPNVVMSNVMTLVGTSPAPLRTFCSLSLAAARSSLYFYLHTSARSSLFLFT